MLKWLIRNRLAKFERSFGYDASYMHELLDTDTAAFLAFAKIQKIPARINSLPGFVVRIKDGIKDGLETIAFEMRDDVIAAIYFVRNPDKLAHVTIES